MTNYERPIEFINWCEHSMELHMIERFDMKSTSIEIEEIKNIDAIESFKNEGRLHGSINNDVVEGLKLSVIRGLPIPRIVVYRNNKGMYIIASGNHRFMAILSLIKEGFLSPRVLIKAYELTEYNNNSLQQFIRSINCFNGERTSIEERKEQAMLALRSGNEMEWVCKTYNLSKSTLASMWNADQLVNILSAIGIDTSISGLGIEKANILYRLKNLGNEVLGELAAIVLNYKITGDWLKEQTDILLNKTMSRKEVDEIIMDIENRAMKECRGNKKRKGLYTGSPNPIRKKLYDMLNKLEKFLEYGLPGNKPFLTYEDLQLEEDEISVIRRKINKIKKSLFEILSF